MTKDFLAKEIFSRYGTIKRARGNFLYTAKNIRLTDMYLEGGRAILGWGGSSAFTQLKNVLSRGITGSFITDYDFRLDRAVSQLLNSARKVFVFINKETAVSETAKLTGLAKESICFWKPWAPAEEGKEKDFMTSGAVILEPPYAWSEDIVLAAVLEENCGEKASVLKTVKPAAPEMACIIRSIYNLIEALQVRQEKDWFVYDQLISKYWTRKGPYLYPKMPQEKYDSFVKHCLDCNLVISPEYSVPSIIPVGAEKGVFALLKKNPFEF